MAEYVCSLDQRISDSVLNDLIELITGTTLSRRNIILKELEMFRGVESNMYSFWIGHFNNCGLCSDRYRHLKTVEYALEISQDL